jgi:hypothetical protein
MLKLKHILASINYFDSDISNSTNTVVYFDGKDGNLYLRFRTMSHTIYSAKFEQTITHQHVLLRRESQSYWWSIRINNIVCARFKEFQSNRPLKVKIGISPENNATGTIEICQITERNYPFYTTGYFVFWLIFYNTFVKVHNHLRGASCEKYQNKWNSIL